MSRRAQPGEAATPSPAGAVGAFDALPPGVLPFAVSRTQAAALLGISPSFFDTLVTDARMPAPFEIGGRVLWDPEELRAAFRAMPRRGQPARSNTWD
ncbi:hypothetical protein SAMN02745194_04268 [Roseomonas rosea]|uniref:Helix-turn-helix domain-containing protein n=1 Tax=Muricoccus roseus TaxID=198092 RepID=A0A1M6Q0U8_9PROT|nr:hypothetical protein [Roseomonas rosea]SHK13804.1 hypothetical protein SAMN02745194_04268 [Roseomonas rosea]